MSVLERKVERHSNWELPHAVLQLSLGLPIFHIRIPAIVHASRVDVAMLLVNPLSPRGKTSVKEAYLPATQAVQVLSP